MLIIRGIGLFALISIIGYLLGSINPAIVITRIVKKTDIRQLGSGNAGMTNVLRSVGKIPAAITFIFDTGKGVLAVLISKWIFESFSMDPILAAYIAGFCALLGHVFPLYYKFKGGKGVLVSAGTILAIDWRIFLAVFLVFIIFVAFTRIISISSIVSAALLPIATYFLNTDFRIIYTLLSLPFMALVIFMHRANIKRLINGTEHKFGKKKGA
jgi:acyl phosphate:glycerol-3-phosphate acyltransferase